MNTFETTNLKCYGVQKGGIMRFLTLLVLVFFIASCGGEITISKSTKKKQSAKQTAAPETVKPSDKAVPESDYVYTSIGKRDPFRSIFDENSGEMEMASEESILSPLQNFEIDSLSVTAILWGISSPAAIVVAPNGMSYTIKTGTLIGRNWGKVVKIKRDSVVVLEQSRLPNGQKVTNQIEMKLPVKTIRPDDASTTLSPVGEEAEGAISLD